MTRAEAKLNDRQPALDPRSALERALAEPGLAPVAAAALWRRLGQAQVAAGQSQQALEAFLAAAELAPDDPETYFELGNLLYAQGHGEAAVTALERAAHLAPSHGGVWHNLGNALASIHAADRAIAALDRAVALEPKNPGFLRARAVHLLQAGRKDEARQAYAALVAVEPNNGNAAFNLAALRRFAESDGEIASMEARFADVTLDDETRAAFGFALFKAYDDLKVHDRAFRFLDAANRLKRRSLAYDSATETSVFAALRQFFTEDFFERHQGQGFADIAPIFIVGMPRSGTTLTEQILSAHSQVAAGGEATALSDMIGQYLTRPGAAGLAISEEGFSGARAAELGRNYAQRMRRVAQAAPRFTDKMPLNFRWIGIAASILPKARFVHCTRDGLETCFSIYSSYFSSSGNRYGYDQVELGHFYRQYKDLMAHWQRVLPGRIFEAPLSGFVDDHEGQTRSLLEFCQLDFEPACLDFHTNSNPVATLSALQVRKPIYRGQDEKMKPYLAYLDPLRAVLAGPQKAGS